MLITIVNTKTKLGKFVLHKYPYQNISLQNSKLQDKVSSTDIMESISKTFDYFAIYNKNNLIETSGQPLSENAVNQIFMANQKNSQIILGIDDNCVLISKSTFLRHNNQQSYGELDISNQNGMFVDVNEEQESLIISISIIWRTDSYQNIEKQRHRLSYLIGVLQRKEEHSQFLSKQIKKIMQEKQNMNIRIKNLVALNIKDNSQQYDEFKLRIVARDIEQQAKKIRQRVGIFRLLKEYFQYWVKDGLFEIKQEEGIWQGSIQSRFFIQKAEKSFINQIQNKTLVMLPPKLTELLPHSLYSNRVKNLCQKVFNCDKVSFRRTLEIHSDIDPQQMYHSLYFLLKNNLAVDIYPIKYPFSYNIFALKELPIKHLVDKFNRIFPNKNCIDTISSYSKYKVVREQEETIIYLLLKQIVGQVKIYIYRKFESQIKESNLCNRQAMLQNILYKYNMSDIDLNQFLTTEPFPFLSKDTTPVSAIIKFIKNNSKNWGFYFVQ